MPASRSRSRPTTRPSPIITLTDEYIRAVERIGLTLPELWAIDRRGLDVAFADEAALAPLRREFDAWAAGVPELAAG